MVSDDTGRAAAARPASATGPALTPAQVRSRRLRNIAVGLAVGLMVVLFYVMTLAKLGGSGVISDPN